MQTPMMSMHLMCNLPCCICIAEDVCQQNKVPCHGCKQPKTLSEAEVPWEGSHTHLHQLSAPCLRKASTRLSCCTSSLLQTARLQQLRPAMELADQANGLT